MRNDPRGGEPRTMTGLMNRTDGLIRETEAVLAQARALLGTLRAAGHGPASPGGPGRGGGPLPESRPTSASA